MSNPFPDLPPDQYEALLSDIEARGQVYPIIVDQHGNVIDGHQRKRIAAALGREPLTKVVEVADEREREQLAIGLNVHRRHMTASERREWILRLAPTGMTQEEIGAAVGVTQTRVANVYADERAAGREPTAGVITSDNPPSGDWGSAINDDKARELARLAAEQRDAQAAVARTREFALDKQGRPPERRGGRPRQPKKPDVTPPWRRQFTTWVRRALPEQRRLLTDMREEIDKALALIDEGGSA